jgi:hypothetical protein
MLQFPQRAQATARPVLQDRSRSGGVHEVLSANLGCRLHIDDWQAAGAGTDRTAGRIPRMSPTPAAIPRWTACSAKRSARSPASPTMPWRCAPAPAQPKPDVEMAERQRRIPPG